MKNITAETSELKAIKLGYSSNKWAWLKSKLFLFLMVHILLLLFIGVKFAYHTDPEKQAVKELQAGNFEVVRATSGYDIDFDLKFYHLQLGRTFSYTVKGTVRDKINPQQEYLSVRQLADSLQKLSAPVSLRFENIGSVPDIEALHLLDNLTDFYHIRNPHFKNIDWLKKNRNIDWLRLGRCSNLENIDAIKNMPGLRTLFLQHCDQLKDLDAISNLSQLNYLNCIGCKNLESIDGISFNSSLSILELLRCENLRDFSVISKVTGLSSLSLPSRSQFKNLNFLKPLTRLEGLWLSDMHDLSELRVLVPTVPLKSLTIGLKENNNIKTLESLPVFPQLYMLSIRNGTALTSLKGIEKCKGLRNLAISEAPNLKDFSPLKQLPNLTKIRLFNMNLSKADLAQLRKDLAPIEVH